MHHNVRGLLLSCFQTPNPVLTLTPNPIVRTGFFIQIDSPPQSQYHRRMEQKVIRNLQSHYIRPHSEDRYPDSVVISLHGYGADGKDLISLGQEWAPHCPNTLFISPDAPHPCEVSPLGRQWFSLEPFSHEIMAERVAETWLIVSDYIDAVADEFSISSQNIVLVGFSQGTMMALQTALCREKPVAGVLGYSGMLLNEELAETTKNKDTLIQLIHGAMDAIIPVSEWFKAMDIFKNNGFKITGYTSKKLPHGIDANGVESGLFFIKEVLK